ncbi:hypothetical protein DAPPUDRAFT_117393 [Daphnia pulex]|uniref:Uncharacterized protein n=1 Tax=Daphnia pulex TaxID=6669 RepID=E9HSI0_DAPPU|nr:hypothetical protein DAPPUDRAFT_117393 [Daphnia pulex]|eukprot:EFX65294.1 hypothetical protein DAPPUDRAFT_117393 [Daphnia pulex]
MSCTPQSLKETLHHLSRVASISGLSSTLESLNFNNGKPFQVDLFVDGSPIRWLGPEDQEIYLGTPIGTKLRFRPSNQFVSNLNKIADSLHLLPSLSHHLAYGRVLKDVLTSLDTEYRKLLGHVTNTVPNSATTPFFYVDRRVGGLDTFSLSDDADIWYLARAVRLLTSKDRLVKDIFNSSRTQFCEDSGRKSQQHFQSGNTFPGGAPTPHPEIHKCSPSSKSCFSLGNRPIDQRHRPPNLLQDRSTTRQLEVSSPSKTFFLSSFDNKCCRHCGESSDNGHVLNNCKVNLTLATQRHDAVLELFHQLLSRKGYAATINRRLPETRLRPDVELQVS